MDFYEVLEKRRTYRDFSDREVSDEAEKIKQIVNAPEGYEFTCLLTMGYPTENAFLPKQKEIHIEERIHTDVW